MAEGFKWYLEVYPNGCIPEDAGDVDLFLCLALLPPNIQRIYVRYKLNVAETRAKHIADKSFGTDYMCWGWPANKLNNSSIQKYKQLTFGVEIQVYGVFDKNDNDVTDKYINIDNNDTKDIKLMQSQVAFMEFRFCWDLIDFV